MSANEPARYPFRRKSQTTQTTQVDSAQQPYREPASIHHYEYQSQNMAAETNGYQFHDANGAPLKKTETIGSIQLTAEQFERMYLGPQNVVKGDLRKTFGNPTPVGLGGFLLALTPLVIQFMGWRGTDGAEGIPTIGTYYFMGGMLAILASIGEFILGNSFPSVFFGVYGSFFITFGATLTPFFNAYIAFDPTPGNRASWLEGSQQVPFESSLAFLSLFMGVFTFVMLIASIRTNIFFVLAFLSLLLTFMFFAASRFYGAANPVLLSRYELAAGAAGFATCMFGWYLLVVEVLTTVDFPINLPVFDLSGIVPGATQLAEKKRGQNSTE